MPGELESATTLGLPSPHVSYFRGVGGVVVCTPRSAAYGHQLIEFLHGVAVARRLGAPLLVLPQVPLANSALHEIEVDGCRILRPGLRHVCARVGHNVQAALEATGEDFAAEIRLRAAEISGEWPWSRTTKKRTLRFAARTRKRLRHGAPPSSGASYYRRRLLLEPFRAQLREEADADARAQARALGVRDETRIVCLHVRGTGYKSGRESQDKGSARSDSARNATLTNHLPACDRLVRDGFTIVRLGDQTMQPLVRQGYVDLATSPLQTGLLELHLLFRAELMIVGESGPSILAYLTDTPLLSVNATDPFSAFPIRCDGNLLMKRAIVLKTGKALTLSQRLDPEWSRLLRDVRRLEYVENTAEEIEMAVVESRAWIAGDGVETERQARWRDTITFQARVNASLKGGAYVRKWGLDNGFLGQGRLVDFALREA